MGVFATVRPSIVSAQRVLFLERNVGSFLADGRARSSCGRCVWGAAERRDYTAAPAAEFAWKLAREEVASGTVADAAVSIVTPTGVKVLAPVSWCSNASWRLMRVAAEQWETIGGVLPALSTSHEVREIQQGWYIGAQVGARRRGSALRRPGGACERLGSRSWRPKGSCRRTDEVVACRRGEGARRSRSEEVEAAAQLGR